MRDRITFKCSECGNENYIGTRNKKKHPDRMNIKKYCPKCNKMTEHKEKDNRCNFAALFLAFLFGQAPRPNG